MRFFILFSSSSLLSSSSSSSFIKKRNQDQSFWLRFFFYSGIFSGFFVLNFFLIISLGNFGQKKRNQDQSFWLRFFFYPEIFSPFFVLEFFSYNKHGEFWSLYAFGGPLIITSKGSKTFYIILKTPLGTGFLFFIGYPLWKIFWGKSACIPPLCSPVFQGLVQIGLEPYFYKKNSL